MLIVFRLKLVFSAVIAVSALLSEKMFFIIKILFESIMVWEILESVSVDNACWDATNKTKAITRE